MAGNRKAIQGKNSPVFIHSRKGIAQLSQFGDLGQMYLNMSGAESESVFADTWGQSLKSTLINSRSIGVTFASASLVGPAFPSAASIGGPYASGLIGELEAVAKMISKRAETGNEREVYHTQIYGYDTHQDTRGKFGYLMAQLDQALVAFKGEMVAQGLWEHVAIAIASDFGRSISANGLGTDHGWGGHYPLISGGLAGGKIYGDYWPDLSDESPINLGRGRMIPGLPFDAQWHALAEWMDVRPEKMAEVLPNKDNCEVGTTLLERSEVFAN